MGKRETARDRLRPMLADTARVEALLLAESGLPGRRANLELAAAFADCVAEQGAAVPWADLMAWAAIPAEDAPTNHPREFLPFSAVQALGALYPTAGAERRGALDNVIRAAARDARWRTREAAAFALQRIGTQDHEALVRIAEAWLEDASPEEQRAILVALAHPPTLAAATSRVRCALDVLDRVLVIVRNTPAETRRSEAHVVLEKALRFVPSVFVAADPDVGFAYLRRWAETEDVGEKKVVAANVRKARLARAHPEECAEVGEILAAG